MFPIESEVFTTQQLERYVLENFKQCKYFLVRYYIRSDKVVLVIPISV